MFGSLGEIGGLMKKFTEMQSKMKKMQEELGKLEMRGTDASNIVEIVVSGDMSQVKSVRINPNYMGKENVEILQDAVRDAVASAMSQVKTEGAKRLTDVTGGIKIPGLN